MREYTVQFIDQNYRVTETKSFSKKRKALRFAWRYLYVDGSHAGYEVMQRRIGGHKDLIALRRPPEPLVPEADPYLDWDNYGE